MKTIFMIFILGVGVAFFEFEEVGAQSITVRGKWTTTINKNDLVSGAGSDLISDYESGSGKFTLQTKGFGKNAGNPNAWRIDVRKSDISWNGSYALFVRRTTDGTGTGTISGGTAYQQVTDSDQTFFSGTNNRRRIKVQSKLSSVSLQNSQTAIYTTDFVFTVVDI